MYSTQTPDAHWLTVHPERGATQGFVSDALQAAPSGWPGPSDASSDELELPPEQAARARTAAIAAARAAQCHGEVHAANACETSEPVLMGGGNLAPPRG